MSLLLALLNQVTSSVINVTLSDSSEGLSSQLGNNTNCEAILSDNPDTISSGLSTSVILAAPLTDSDDIISATVVSSVTCNSSLEIFLTALTT